MQTETPRSIERHDHAHRPNRSAVIPTARRLGASSQYAGRGVTIAFLDSGFHRHPDLADLGDRIVALDDVTGAAPEIGSHPWHWHGTQTSVVAAGSGFLSGGVYAGLASESRLALLKVSDRGRIRDADIVRGLEWVVANRDRYGIRVANLSLGGDRDDSYAASAVDAAAEAAVAAGIVVVVAAGNAGASENHVPIPPANAPSVITVGGYDDGNRLGRRPLAMYASSYGPTVDGLFKPEIVAPAIWVAAPILPGTEAYDRAEALSEIDSTPDALLSDLPPTVWRAANLPPHSHHDPETLRERVAALLVEHKIVAAHYQHVDGTSFAAPIVASIVAQMLEANPQLSPAAVKRILISSADRIPGVPVERQGYGVVNARRAVELAAAERHPARDAAGQPPYCTRAGLVFTLHDDAASRVAVAGDFNGWDTGRAALERVTPGTWRADVVPPAPGRYRYKFLVDGSRWTDDPANDNREPDGYGGFNSIVSVG